MTNNNTEFKFDKLLGLELCYIHIIRLWLKFTNENMKCTNPDNSRENLYRMLRDFFIEPKFEFYKAQALYNTFTGVLKQPLMEWKIADEHFFTKLSKYYKKLYVKSKLEQIEGDFTNG